MTVAPVIQAVDEARNFGVAGDDVVRKQVWSSHGVDRSESLETMCRENLHFAYEQIEHEHSGLQVVSRQSKGIHGAKDATGAEPGMVTACLLFSTTTNSRVTVCNEILA